MKLTKELLRRVEESLHINLTPEQRLIVLYWYGQEPRHGWDEEDFALGVREVMRFYPDHRPKRAVELGLSPQLRKERKAFLKRESAAYLKANDMTPEERKDILVWIKSGESVRENPWLMTDDYGVPMDYLSAMRTAEELRAQRMGL